MLDLLMLATALLGVSFIVLSCCSPPTSSKASFNQVSNDNDGMATGIEDSKPRKLTAIDCDNIYKEKTIEDEEKKKERKRKGRESVSKSSAPPSRPTKKKSTQAGGGKEKSLKKRKSPDDKDDKVKKRQGDKKEGRKRKSTSAENEKNSIGRNAATAIDSDSRGRPARDEKNKKKKRKGDEQRDKDKEDESNKGEEGGGGGSKLSLDDSRKTSGTPKLLLAPTQLPSTERVAETMASRDKMDEMESVKQKRDGSPCTPVLSPTAVPPSAEPTQVDSEKPRKGSNETTPPRPPLPAKSPKKPPPKKKVNKKKEEEVRLWNEAIARGNVFRPRKDDETIDEVQVDWNG